MISRPTRSSWETCARLRLSTARMGTAGCIRKSSPNWRPMTSWSRACARPKTRLLRSMKWIYVSRRRREIANQLVLPGSALETQSTCSLCMMKSRRQLSALGLEVAVPWPTLKTRWLLHCGTKMSVQVTDNLKWGQALPNRSASCVISS